MLDPVALGALRLGAREAAVEFGAGGQDEARLAVGAGRGLVGPLGDPNFGTGRDRGEGRGERRPGVRPGRTVARAGGVRVDVVADRDDEVPVLDERAGGDRGNGVLRRLGRHGALAGGGFHDAAPARGDLERVVSVGVGRRDGGSVAGRDAKARDREAVRVRHAAAHRALRRAVGDQRDAPAVADHVVGALANRDGDRLERAAGRGRRDRDRRGARHADVGPDALRVARRGADRGAGGVLDRDGHAGTGRSVRIEHAARDDFAGLLREDVEDGLQEGVAGPVRVEVPAVGRTAPSEVHVVVEGAVLEPVAVEDDLVRGRAGVDGVAGVEVRAEHVRDRREVARPEEGARVLERAGDDGRALVGAGAAAGVARAVEDADVEEQRAAGLALRVGRRRVGRHRVPLVGAAVAVAAARGEHRPRRRPVGRNGNRVLDPADAGLRPLVVVHDLAERGLHAAADEVARRVVVLAVAALAPLDVAEDLVDAQVRDVARRRRRELVVRRLGRGAVLRPARDGVGLERLEGPGVRVLLPFPGRGRRGRTRGGEVHAGKRAADEVVRRRDGIPERLVELALGGEAGDGRHPVVRRHEDPPLRLHLEGPGEHDLLAVDLGGDGPRRAGGGADGAVEQLAARVGGVALHELGRPFGRNRRGEGGYGQGEARRKRCDGEERTDWLHVEIRLLGEKPMLHMQGFHGAGWIGEPARAIIRRARRRRRRRGRTRRGPSRTGRRRRLPRRTGTARRRSASTTRRRRDRRPRRPGW